MATATESPTTPFEGAFENVRKAAETAMKMQQDMFDQWTKMWPGMAQPKDDVVGRIQKFQKDWANTVNDMTRKQREIWEEQCRAGVESLHEAFHLTSSKDPAELREHFESLFRKTMDGIKTLSETQMRNFQDAMQKWSELSQTKA
jgi:hypothetical protein